MREGAGVQLQRVARRSLAAGVFEQLRGEILAGRIGPGDALPAERQLTESFGVNRQAVREALQRLAQVGLVAIRQGEPTRVRDFRLSAGLDMLAGLLTGADGSVDPAVVRSVMELRAAIGPDAARLCAARATPALVDRLESAAAALRVAPTVAARGPASLEVWDAVIDGSGNIAYRLLFNGLREVYEPALAVLAPVLEAELTDDDGHTAMVAAVRAGDGEGAREAARDLLAHGTVAVTTVLADTVLADTLSADTVLEQR